MTTASARVIESPGACTATAAIGSLSYITCETVAALGFPRKRPIADVARAEIFGDAATSNQRSAKKRRIWSGMRRNAANGMLPLPASGR